MQLSEFMLQHVSEVLPRGLRGVARRGRGLYETPVFLLLGVRAIVKRAFLPVKSLQGLDHEWSSYLTEIEALQKPGGFACVKLRLLVVRC